MPGFADHMRGFAIGDGIRMYMCFVPKGTNPAETVSIYRVEEKLDKPDLIFNVPEEGKMKLALVRDDSEYDEIFFLVKELGLVTRPEEVR